MRKCVCKSLFVSVCFSSFLFLCKFECVCMFLMCVFVCVYEFLGVCMHKCVCISKCVSMRKFVYA